MFVFPRENTHFHKISDPEFYEKSIKNQCKNRVKKVMEQINEQTPKKEPTWEPKSMKNRENRGTQIDAKNVKILGQFFGTRWSGVCPPFSRPVVYLR